MPALRIKQDTYQLLKDYAIDTDRSLANAADHLLTKYLVEWPDIRAHKMAPRAGLTLGTSKPVGPEDVEEAQKIMDSKMLPNPPRASIYDVRSID